MSLESSPLRPPESRRHWLAHTLREAIARGEIRPGTRLVERDLSARTGVSRGPVREALLQLENEGLLVSRSYRGTEVVAVSEEEVEEILIPTRVVLERFAFRQARPRLTEDDYAKLEGLVEILRRAAKDGDRLTIVEADVKFHELVIIRSEKPHCEQLWRTIVPRVRAFFYDEAPRHKSLRNIVTEHRTLLEVLKRDDESALVAEVERHVVERPSFGGHGPPARK